MKKKNNIKLILINLIIIAIIAIIACILTKIEDILYYVMDNSPWLVIGFLLIMAVLIIVLTADCLIKEYKKEPEKIKKYIMDSIKQVLICFFIGAIVVGFIVFILIYNA